jgi:phosphate transport system substrate-binding protein
MPANLRLFIPDPDGADSYPIVTYSWLLIRRHYDDQKVSAALRDLIHWCLNEGQRSAEFLGYVRLAPRVVSQAIAAMDSNGS